MTVHTPLESAPDRERPPTCDGLSAPYQTAGWPGCGGRIKAAPEDFRVDELPLYEPSGSGEHVYVRLWKRGLSTRAALQRLSDATGIPWPRIGWAGRKDAQAITTQWVSLHAPPAAADPPLQAAESEDLRILDVTRHANKLRRGHLRGNRFFVRIRDVRMPVTWESLVSVCINRGFPNLFGPQRFGPSGDNPAAGRRVLARSRFARRLRDSERFEIHALQAELFNALVARRLRETGCVDRFLPGDIAVLHRNGSSFRVRSEGLADAQARAAGRELSPSAPLFGYRVALAEGDPGAWEREALRSEGFALEHFRFGSKDASIAGERRATRAFPLDFVWRRETGNSLVLELTLGPGVYATALLRELMKTGAPQPHGSDLPDATED